ncbi:hypothetical protein bcgnr5390_08180 [Bacillus luti]
MRNDCKSEKLLGEEKRKSGLECVIYSRRKIGWGNVEYERHTNVSFK